MARSFNGSTSKLRTASGGTNFTGAVTIAAIIKLASARDANWNNILAQLTSAGGTTGYVLERDSANQLAFGKSGSSSTRSNTGGSTPFTVASADGWVLVVANKASGNVSVSYHKYPYATGAFTHNVPTGTESDTVAPGSGSLIEIGGDYGGSTDWFQGDIAVAAIWNRSLSNAEIENLPFTLQEWFNTSPAGLWMLDQDKTTQLVNDLSGGGSLESSSVALGISTVHPPVFNYTDGIWLPTIVKPATGGTPISMSDSGAGADTASMSGQLSGSDSGSGTDTASGSASLSVSDSGAGTDTISFSTPVAMSDSGSGSDTAAVSASLTGSDSGSGADTASGSAALSVSDSGAGVDSSALAAQVSLSDSGSGVDGASVSTLGNPNFSDAGVGVDSISIVVKVSFADLGVGTDLGTMSFASTTADSGSGIDGIVTTVSLVAADSGSGSDSAALTRATIAVGDLATGTDQGAATYVLPGIIDFGSGVDSIIKSAGRMIGTIQTGRMASQSRAGYTTRGEPGSSPNVEAGETKERLI